MENVEKQPWWKSLLKYFVHGIAFSIIDTLMTVVWALVLVVLVIAGSIIGLIIGLIILILIMGALNSILTDFIWSIQIKMGWKSLLTHGFVLFIVLIIAHIPAFIVSYALPSIATTVVLFIIYAFIDGFIARNVADWWQEEPEIDEEEK